MSQNGTSGFNSELLELAGSWYDSTSAPEPTAGVLQRLNRLLGGTFILQQCRDIASGAVLQSTAVGPDGPEPHENCLAHWGRDDPRRASLHAQPLKTAWRCHEHLTDSMVAQSAFYREWMLPLGLRWTLATRFRVGEVETVVACSRAVLAHPFEDWAAQEMALLAPHMARAAAMQAEIEGLRLAADTGHDCVMHLSLPCMLTDQAGRCIETSPSFNEASSRLGLIKVMGRLRFQNPEMQGRLERGLMETQLTAVRQDLPFVGVDRSQWVVHLIPWHMVEQNSHLPVGGMILAVFEPKLQHDSPGVPAENPFHSRLTPAEQEVLGGMLRGMPAKVIAQERNSSFNTVRAQIVSILEKSGFSSQKELMAHMGHSTWSESNFSAPVAPAEPSGRAHVNT